MQKIYSEKAIDLQHQLKELIALSVDESINYKIENEGIRAIGNLIIKGECHNHSGIKVSFEETMGLDVLTTFDKILDQRDFGIKVEDFDYTIRDGNINITIEAGVHGVISDGDSSDNTTNRENELELVIENIIIEKVPKISFRNKPIEWGKKYKLTLEDEQIWIGKFENVDYDTRFVLDIPSISKKTTDIVYGIDTLNIRDIEEC